MEGGIQVGGVGLKRGLTYHIEMVDDHWHESVVDDRLYLLLVASCDVRQEPHRFL